MNDDDDANLKEDDLPIKSETRLHHLR